MKNYEDTLVELGAMCAALKRQLGEGWRDGEHEPFVLVKKHSYLDGAIKVRCCSKGYLPLIKVTRFYPSGMPAVTTEHTVVAEALRAVRKLEAK